MGAEALTRADTGREISTDDWDRWVSASALRNYVLGDPLLDWMNLYGESRGFVRDDRLASYDPRTDFTHFVFEQGRRFERAVVELLRQRYPQHGIVTVADGPEDIRNANVAIRTFEAMRDGVPLINQGVLWDAEHRTYGAPDLLVRSDVLREMFPDALAAGHAAMRVPDLGGPAHYCVVDIKFSTLHLNVFSLAEVPFSKAQRLRELGGAVPPIPH